MKHVKSRFEGINGLPADYFWYSIKGKKNRLIGIQELEVWLANVIPILDGEEFLIRASFIDVIVYRYLVKPTRKWQSLSLENKIGIIEILISIITIILSLIFNLPSEILKLIIKVYS